MSAEMVDRRNWLGMARDNRLILLGLAVLLAVIILIITLPLFARPQSYPVKMNGKYGYIDRKGKVTVTPQFDAAQPFTDGYAAVKLGDRWGYIDHAGKLVISPQYDLAD